MDWRTVRFDWNRARAFLVTAEEGTFSAAARALGLTQPTVGRQVASLEEELGVLLFARVGAGLELTEAGLDLLAHVRQMGQAASRLSRTATGQSESVEGLVSVTASETVCAHMLPRALRRLRVEQPGIEVQLVPANDARDLVRREADLAVRHFRSTQPDLITRKLRDTTAGFYATPAYIEQLGPVEGPADLQRADWFGFDHTDTMIDGLRGLGVELERHHFPIVTDNHLVQWAYCRQGLGICMMMEEIGDAEPAVRRMLPELGIPLPIWLVVHRELRTSRRIRLVYELLAEVLAVPLSAPVSAAPA